MTGMHSRKSAIAQNTSGVAIHVLYGLMTLYYYPVISFPYERTSLGSVLSPVVSPAPAPMAAIVDQKSTRSQNRSQSRNRMPRLPPPKS